MIEAMRAGISGQERDERGGSATLSAELAALARRVSAGVVVVRVAPTGAGSGVVWDDQRLIITNAHVATQPELEVITPDGRALRARVIARAEPLDLAAIRVTDSDGGALIPAAIGDSAALRVGELVVAIGNPLGERNVTTLGLVAGTGPIAQPGGSREALRLAITLRPGNSGGALVDSRGQVVGIPHLVIGVGLALAVPSHVVQRFIQRAVG